MNEILAKLEDKLDLRPKLEQIKLQRIFKDLNLYINRLRQGVDLRIAFFQLGGIARQIVKFVMRPDVINKSELGSHLPQVLNMVHTSPDGTGESLYQMKPLEHERPHKVVSMIELSREYAADPQQTDALQYDSAEHEKKLFFEAVATDKLYTVKEMVRRNPKLITVVNENLQYGLHIACRRNVARIAEFLHGKDGSIAEKLDLNGDSCVNLALKTRNPELIKLFIS